MSANSEDRTNGHANGSLGGLNSQELADLLDRWGANLTAWPDQNAAKRAQRLIDQDPAAQSHLAEAQALDGLLDAVSAPASLAGLADRIAGQVAEAPPPSNVVSLAGAGRRRRFGWPSLALAASLIIGLVLGVGTSPDTVDGWLGSTTVYAADYLGFGPSETIE